MTYVEGASLHQERAGATVFARYAFNELWSFIAGWAVLLDFVILIAITSFSATNYMAAFWAPLGRGGAELAPRARRSSSTSRVRNIRGFSPRPAPSASTALVLADLALQLVLIVVGADPLLRPGRAHRPDRARHDPERGGLLFALTVATVAFTGLESASPAWPARSRSAGAASSGWSPRAAASVIVVYVGIALVARRRRCRSRRRASRGSATRSRRPCSAIVRGVSTRTGCADARAVRRRGGSRR